MKRALYLAVAMIIASHARPQDELIRKRIYRINKDAVVRIYLGGQFNGTGFIVSSDGLIATANHVITTRTRNQYAAGVTVEINDRNYIPEPVDVSPYQRDYDSALLKVNGLSGLPHVTLGDWSKISVGDDVFIVTSLPNFGPILTAGIVSGKGDIEWKFGDTPKPVKTILFQIPVRSGFSGSPIFDSKGLVVGIEDTKVFGISPALDELRNESQASAHISISGIDIGESFTELINNLDHNLISGLGSGVDIEYARHIQESEHK